MASHRDLSDQQLLDRLLERERELVQARFRHSMNQLENTARLGQLRREVARLKTEARSRELAQGLPKDDLVRQHRPSFGASPETAAAPSEQKGGFLSGIVDKLSGKE